MTVTRSGTASAAPPAPAPTQAPTPAPGTPSPLATRLGSLVSSLRSGFEGTPGRMRAVAAVTVLAALVFGVYAGHKPRELQYQLDFKGLTVGDKHFGYDQFRSFSVLPEGAFSSIVFMPLKRFAVTTTIYYAPEDEDRIVKVLSDHLPLENRGHDAIDRLMHRIHF